MRQKASPRNQIETRGTQTKHAENSWLLGVVNAAPAMLNHGMPPKGGRRDGGLCCFGIVASCVYWVDIGSIMIP